MKNGSIKKRGRVWWIRYYVNGRRFEESSRSQREGDARRLLRLRLGDAERGMVITPSQHQLRFQTAAADLLKEYEINARKTLSSAQRRLRKHLSPFFGDRRLVEIGSADIAQFVHARLGSESPNGARPSNAEINRELALLKRMFTLAIQNGKLHQRPHIAMLPENNVRTGFFDEEMLESVCRHLTSPLAAVVRFAYETGWRVPSEVLTLQWRQVSFTERLSPNQAVPGTVRLEQGSTKNGDGRVFPMTSRMRTLLLAQQELSSALAGNGTLCPWVFHRNGRPIREFRGKWRAACFAAGCPGRIPHDLRRSAVRNLVRAGVSDRVAMRLTGHRTRSVFDRYNIVSDGDLAAAAVRLDGVHLVSGGSSR